MKNFYCYSYKLKNFLKLQGISYLYKLTHKNGNKCWVFQSSAELNKALNDWNKYKTIFK